MVGKRLGKAVVRNRAKRIFRELVRQVRHHLIEGQDVLIFPRREALSVRHLLLREAWLAALRRKGLLSAESDLPCNGSASV